MLPGSFDALGAPELIRFTGDEADPDSGQDGGIFQVAGRASRSGLVAGADARRLRQLRAWFDVHLARPRRFSPFRDGWRRSASGFPVRTPIAISWFRPGARAHLERAAEMAAILRGHGLVIRETRTRRPGYVTYEDAHQVVAVPFAEGLATGSGWSPP